MKYLFFDIECAGVYKNMAKICAFGYCLTDEQFHILEKEDILINPQGGFHLTDRKGEQGLVLPYQHEDFKTYPTFKQQSERIYALLQDSDTLVLGHAVQNDVKYLNLESKRFSLPSFCFRFADTQFLYMNMEGDFSRQYGLSGIAERLGVEFTPHRAVDDAYATMKIAEAMCKRENCSIIELLKKYSVYTGTICDYEITQSTSAGFEKYKKEREKQKRQRERARAEFHVFAERAKRKRAKEGKLQDKTVCFSHAVELDTPLAKKLLQAAFAQAARVTFRAEECDLYVCYEEENCPRKKSVQAKNTPIYTPESFAQYLGL